MNATSSLSAPQPSSSHLPPKTPRPNRDFDPTKYSTRLIALKFAYLGQRYNGFEHHANNKTPLPTIEEELWKALKKGHLITPTVSSMVDPEDINWEGCEYSKCGRTDKGVSAFGQVIGIRVRSNRPRGHREEEVTDTELGQSIALESPAQTNGTPLESTPSNETVTPKPSYSPVSGSESSAARPFHDVNDELPYPQILNRLLPKDIRILAWCPSPPTDFSARFSCRERRYRYFFTQPAFAPVPGSQGFPIDPRHGQRRREGWLDIKAMREGARHFVGLHDFRNFCKIDPSKEITNFERRIFHADIEAVAPNTGPVGYIANPDVRMSEESDVSASTSNGTVPGTPSTPQVYTFTVHGSAFLWHQVRHMASIIFLIGQGLETPSIVPALLDMKTNPTKPMYELADDAPLVLWDCIFPNEGDDSRKDALGWVYVGDQMGAENGATTAAARGKHRTGGVVEDLWRVWRERKIDEVLAGMLLDLAAGQGNSGVNSKPYSHERQDGKGKPSSSQKVFDGGNAPRLVGRYVPILQRPRMESVEVVNARYAARKRLLRPKGDE